jgi:hypothetical protein
VPSEQMELAGGDDGNGEYLAVAGTGLGMGAVTKQDHYLVIHHEDRYNHVVVHRSSPR